MIPSPYRGHQMVATETGKRTHLLAKGTQQTLCGHPAWFDVNRARQANICRLCIHSARLIQKADEESAQGDA